MKLQKKYLKSVFSKEIDLQLLKNLLSLYFFSTTITTPLPLWCRRTHCKFQQWKMILKGNLLTHSKMFQKTLCLISHWSLVFCTDLLTLISPKSFCLVVRLGRSIESRNLVCDQFTPMAFKELFKEYFNLIVWFCLITIIFFSFSSSFLTNTLTDRFFKFKKSFSWLFTPAYHWHLLLSLIPSALFL